MNVLVPDICRAAAVQLETGGWCQEAMYFGTAACMRGAIKDQIDWGDDNAYRLAIDTYGVVALLLGAESYSSLPEDQITSWNDEQGRTADEVIAKLREAADRAEEAL